MTRQLSGYALPLSVVVAVLWGILNVGIVAGGAAWWHTQKSQAIATSESALRGLEKHLNHLLDYSEQELHRLQYDIRRSNGDLESIRLLLAEESNRNLGLLRFAWVDAQDIVRVSSAGGIRTDSYSVADRAYISQTRTQPFHPVISPVLLHRVTQKPFIVVAMGVESLAQHYMGTLNVTLHLDVLRNRIRDQMKLCRCDFAVFSPHAEIIYTSQTATKKNNHQKATGRFVVDGQIGYGRIKDILRQSVVITLGLMLLVNGVLWLMFLLIRRRILSLLHPTDDQTTLPSSALQALDLAEKSAHHFRNLGSSYQSLSQQLLETQTHLREAKTSLVALQNEQQTVGSATSQQLKDCWKAIEQYAAHLDDLIAGQMLDPDRRYDYDDVVEMGSSLMGFSDAIACLHRGVGDGAADLPLSLSGLLNEVMAKHNTSVERRNLSLILTYDKSPPIYRYQEHVRMALTCLLGEWIRCSEDEAKLEITVLRSDVGEAIHIRSSFLRLSQLPASLRSASQLLPSKDNHAAILSWLHSLSGVSISQLLAEQAGTSLSIHYHQNRSFEVIWRLD